MLRVKYYNMKGKRICVILALRVFREAAFVLSDFAMLNSSMFRGNRVLDLGAGKRPSTCRKYEK